MSKEQTIQEMEFELAMSALTRVADQVARTQVIDDTAQLLAVLNNAAAKWRAVQKTRAALKLVPYVIDEIGR